MYSPLYSYATALLLLPLGQPLLLGSTTALATAAVVLSTQAAHAQSADDYVDAGIEKGKSGDLQGAKIGRASCRERV